MNKFLIVAVAALALGAAPAIAAEHGGGGHSEASGHMSAGHDGMRGGGDRGIGGMRRDGGHGYGGHEGRRFGVDVPFAPCVPPFLNTYRCYGYDY
jgi:hypothetical protein